MVQSQYYAADNYYNYFYNQQYQPQQYWPQPQAVRYPSPQAYVPRQPPQAISPPLQQQIPQQQPRVQTFVPDKKPSAPQGQGRIISANTYEFDLPPAPPSRFLPDEEKTKVLSLNKQGRPEHAGNASPQQRIRLITGATNNTRQNPAPPQVQIHHVQVPRILQKAVIATPSQMTHLIASVTTASPVAQPIITTQTTRFLVPSSTTTAAPITERRFEPETTTKAASHLSPNSKKINPNKIFLQCCLNKKVPKTCESKCNFDNINKKTLTAMFLGSDACPQSYGLDLFACAAQEEDHTNCCKTKNVQRTSAGSKCLAFCNLTPESHFQADASYLPCWGVLNDVKNCFKEGILNGGPL
ncbi:protein of unknown function DB domain-containing protein [Aphelenchoides bicaudatus]|nr:protein of unknown function DB domain-containing protein [Aphelenchoides bicaudatus]